MKNISQILNSNFCTQCGACKSFCPNSCITSTWNSNYGYKYTVHTEQCNNCGLCLTVCAADIFNFEFTSSSFSNEQYFNPYFGKYINCYTGWARDAQQRYLCSSGGIATEIAKSALRNHLVTAVILPVQDKENPLVFSPKLLHSIEEIEVNRGSKYLPIEQLSIIKSLLNSKEEVLFVGLPCHIQGLRNIQNNLPWVKEKIKFTLGLFCGLNWAPVATEDIVLRNSMRVSEICYINHRTKGWPGNLLILDNSGNKIELMYPNYINKSFSANILPRCLYCSDGTSELADISCGDAWLNKFKNDRLGTSIFIIRTEKGNELLSASKCSKEIVKSNPNDIIESQRFMLKSKKVFSYFRRRLLNYHNDIYTTKPNLPISISDYIQFIQIEFKRVLLKLYNSLLIK